MSKTMKKSIALMLVILQLIVLLPVTSLQAKAVTPPQAEESVPTLNPVIEGTVRFGSFNYTGDTANNRDGVDYVTTFYYSDDYFSPSAVNPNANAKTMSWSALEDPSMVTLSHDFTLAAFGSSENTIPVDWSQKSKNGERFLQDCGFENIFVNDEFNQQTGRDTLGYLFGSKEITVWDAASQSNKTFTLVAVGVRGAGYGAEWASNFTIGDKNGNAAVNKSYSGTYRHKGFDDGAKKVLADLDTYVAGLSGDVKYWVVGYSRAGAIANLVAGDITRQAAKYHTSMDNVYGYTFEAAAGALKSEDPNGTNYPNIHNIINNMDVVPRMSTPLFNHCRLGVDYLLPYYGNTSAANNTAYYNNMYSVLPTVADIADVYNQNLTGNEKDNIQDPVITDSDPAVYPYNRTIQIKEFGITNFNNGFVDDVSNSDSDIAPNSGLYLDQFLDQFLDAFFKCIAWDYEYFYIVDHWLYSDYMTDRMTRDPMSHEQQYVKNYQEALRTLAYHALKQPGMGLGALDGVMDNAMDAIDFGTIWNGAGIAVHYGEMNTGIRYNRAVYLMIDPMGDIVNKVIDQTGLFQEEDLPEVHAAIKTIMPVLTWLYCEDHHSTGGEYLGTIFANVGTVLVTHIPEQGISWDQSLDDVFISDYREVTVPKATVVNLYEFRAGLEDALSANAAGAKVATVDEGDLDSKDARITVTDPFYETDDAGNTMKMVTIRYPGNLDIRFDVSPAEGERFEDLYVALRDFKPNDVLNVKSTASRAANGNISDTAIDHDMTTGYETASAQEINKLTASTVIPMSDKDTLHIMAWHGRNQVEDSFESTYDISKTVYVNTIVEGQFRQDADGETYLPYVMDQTGSEFTCAEIQDQITYSSALYGGTGVDADGFGSKVDVSLPTVASDNVVWKYFTTDASAKNDQRLSSDIAPYAADYEDGPVSSFSFGTNTDRKAALEQEDTVYHVFYNGDFRYTVTWTQEDGTVLETDENVKYNAQPSFDGAEPVKPADAQYTYTFAGWEPELNPVTADVTYKAKFDAAVNQYRIRFLDENGGLLQESDVPYGETPTAPAAPTKPSDKEHHYSFNGWSPAITAVTGEAAYTATYVASDRLYTVNWLDDDGSVIRTAENVRYADVASHAPADPVKAADAQFTYRFAGWTPEQIDGDTIRFTATYDKTLRSYQVTWVSEGETLKTDTVDYGGMPAYAGETPAKAADVQYTYSFAGWTPEISAVTGDVTYTAVFDRTVNAYTVRFVNFDGTELQSTEVPYGEVPVYSGETPVKAADAQYTYTFSGWDPELAAVSGDAVYTAQFSSTVNTYTITWLNEDGSVIDTAQVAYGEMPGHADPVKAADAQYTYTFAGWTPAVAPVTGDAAYTAQFSSTVNTYTITWLNEDGSVIDTTEAAYGSVPSHENPVKASDGQYSYTFTGWSPEVTAVTGPASYQAQFRADRIIHVSFQAPDVQNNNSMADLGGTENGIAEQPNYPSYMGWDLTGVTVTSGSASEVVPVGADGEIPTDDLNAAILRVLAASGEADVMVTANYQEDDTQTYTVNLKYQMPNGEIVENYTTESKTVGEAMRITTSETFKDGANTYCFDHWLIDGETYKSLSVTMRPNVAGSYDAVAVYVDGDEVVNEADLKVVNAYAETQNGVNKTAVTLSYTVPEGCTVQAVGFRVSTKDPTLQTTYSTSTSKLTTNDGSYTVHIKVAGKETRDVYVCAYLTYTDLNGSTRTILTDPVAYVWSNF